MPAHARRRPRSMPSIQDSATEPLPQQHHPESSGVGHRWAGRSADGLRPEPDRNHRGVGQIPENDSALSLLPGGRSRRRPQQTGDRDPGRRRARPVPEPSERPLVGGRGSGSVLGRSHSPRLLSLRRHDGAGHPFEQRGAWAGDCLGVAENLTREQPLAGPRARLRLVRRSSIAAAATRPRPDEVSWG